MIPSIVVLWLGVHCVIPSTWNLWVIGGETQIQILLSLCWLKLRANCVQVCKFNFNAVLWFCNNDLIVAFRMVTNVNIKL